MASFNASDFVVKPSESVTIVKRGRKPSAEKLAETKLVWSRKAYAGEPKIAQLMFYLTGTVPAPWGDVLPVAEITHVLSATMVVGASYTSVENRDVLRVRLPLEWFGSAPTVHTGQLQPTPASQRLVILKHGERHCRVSTGDIGEIIARRLGLTVPTLLLQRIVRFAEQSEDHLAEYPEGFPLLVSSPTPTSEQPETSLDAILAETVA